MVVDAPLGEAIGQYNEDLGMRADAQGEADHPFPG